MTIAIKGLIHFYSEMKRTYPSMKPFEEIRIYFGLVDYGKRFIHYEKEIPSSTPKALYYTKSSTSRRSIRTTNHMTSNGESRSIG